MVNHPPPITRKANRVLALSFEGFVPFV